MFVALVIQQAKRPCFFLYCHLCSVRIYHTFPHYLINVTDLRKKLCNVKFDLISSATFAEAFLILRRIQRDIVINMRRTLCEVPVILVRL